MLAVTGTASLDGDLVIEPIEDFIPRTGQQFTVITFSSSVGEFAGVSNPLRYALTYNSTDVTVTVLAVVGDLDDDGNVDSEDFMLFAGCTSGPDVDYVQGCDEADLDVDSDVDLADFLAFQPTFTGS